MAWRAALPLPKGGKASIKGKHGKTDAMKGFHPKRSSGDTSGSSEVVSKGSGKFKGKTTVTESYQGLEDGKGTGKFGDTAKGKTDTTKGSHKGSSGDSVGPKGSGMFKGNSDVTENNQGLEDGKGKGKFGDTMKGKTDTMKGSHPKGSSGDSVGPKGSGMFKGNSDVTENNQGLEDGKGKGKFGDTMKGKTDAMKGSHPKGSSGSSEVVSKGSGKFKGNSDVTEIDQGFEDGKGKGKFGDTTKGKTDTMKGYRKGSGDDTSGLTNGVSKGSGKFKGKTTVTESYQGFVDGKGKGKFGDTKGKTDNTKGSHKGSSGDDTSGSADVVSKGSVKGNSDVTENNQGLEDGKGKGKFGDTMKGKTDTMKGSHKGSSGDSVGPKGSGMFKGNSDVTENNQVLEDGKGKGKFGDTMKGKTDTMKGSHPKGSSGDSVGPKGSGMFKGNSDVTENNQGLEDGKGKGKFGDTMKGKTDTTKGYRKGSSGENISGSSEVVSKGAGKFKGKLRLSQRITRAWRMARARASLGTPRRARPTPLRVPTKVLGMILLVPLLLQRVLASPGGRPMSPRLTSALWARVLGTPRRARATPGRVPTPKELPRVLESIQANLWRRTAHIPSIRG